MLVTVATVTDQPRERYARGEGERLRVDLLDAAAELMAETGSVEGTSLRAIARRVGVSPTAVYKHFADHDELLQASVDHCWSNFSTALFAAADSENNPFEAFRAMGDAYVRFALEHQGQYRVMFSNRIHLEGFTKSIGETAYEGLIGVVEQMLAELGDDRDPGFVAAQVHTWIHGIVDLVGNHPDAEWPATDALLDGLADALRLRPSDPHG